MSIEISTSPALRYNHPMICQMTDIYNGRVTYLSAAIFAAQHCKSTTLAHSTDIISCRTSHKAPRGGFPFGDNLVQLLWSRWNILRLGFGILSKVHEIGSFKTARYCRHDRVVTRRRCQTRGGLQAISRDVGGRLFGFLLLLLFFLLFRLLFGFYDNV